MDITNGNGCQWSCLIFDHVDASQEKSNSLITRIPHLSMVNKFHDILLFESPTFWHSLKKLNVKILLEQKHESI